MKTRVKCPGCRAFLLAYEDPPHANLEVRCRTCHKTVAIVYGQPRLVGSEPAPPLGLTRALP